MRFKFLVLALVASLVAVSAALAGDHPGKGPKPKTGPGCTYKLAGTATIAVDAKTRINRQGSHNLGALAPSDRVHVTAKVCKADLKDGATPDLTARKIGAHPAEVAAPTS